MDYQLAGCLSNINQNQSCVQNMPIIMGGWRGVGRRPKKELRIPYVILCIQIALSANYEFALNEKHIRSMVTF